MQKKAILPLNDVPPLKCSVVPQLRQNGHLKSDGVRFELTVQDYWTPVFKTGAFNHSATHP